MRTKRNRIKKTQEEEKAGQREKENEIKRARKKT